MEIRSIWKQKWGIGFLFFLLLVLPFPKGREGNLICENVILQRPYSYSSMCFLKPPPPQKKIIIITLALDKVLTLDYAYMPSLFLPLFQLWFPLKIVGPFVLLVSTKNIFFAWQTEGNFHFKVQPLGVPSERKNIFKCRLLRVWTRKLKDCIT